jgi:peptidyl-prolyl cis-trans isomerase B (cyclophilin B)
VHLETERGVLVLRLLPEQAPLTVQAFLEQVASGAQDGVAFHRLIPGVLIQGGDFAMGDGTGRMPYGLRTEITQLPQRRLVVGMASNGNDTEGSQFFVLLSDYLALEGRFTVFGWIEEGEKVLEGLLEGDRVLRAWLE